MQSTLEFTKLEGCGNHFILIDACRSPYVINHLQPELITQLCRSNFGIGADGILVLKQAQTHSKSSQANFEMLVYNADGSIAQMCGNGLRCLVRYLQSDYGLFDTQNHAYIHTGAGPLRVELMSYNFGEDRMNSIQQFIGVEMNWPSIQECVRFEDLDFEILNLGNPHYVTYNSDNFSSRAKLAEKWSNLIPDGVNLSFAQQISPKALNLHVHERGCGWTLACGTGACATVYTGYKMGLFELGQPIEVNLPGGQLIIEIQKNCLWMWGPANEIFRGQAKL